MSAEEQTFYKKWVEVQQLTNYINKSGISKAKIWTPTDINDQELTIKEIDQLNPTIVHVVDDPIDRRAAIKCGKAFMTLPPILI